MQQQEENSKRDHGQPTFWQVVQSVLAAFFGVQSAKNRERDFTAGRPSAYIFVGVAMAALVVLVILGLVRLIMYLAGA